MDQIPVPKNLIGDRKPDGEREHAKALPKYNCIIPKSTYSIIWYRIHMIYPNFWIFPLFICALLNFRRMHRIRLKMEKIYHYCSSFCAFWANCGKQVCNNNIGRNKSKAAEVESTQIMTLELKVQGNLGQPFSVNIIGFISYQVLRYLWQLKNLRRLLCSEFEIICNDKRLKLLSGNVGMVPRLFDFSMLPKPFLSASVALLAF